MNTCVARDGFILNAACVALLIACGIFTIGVAGEAAKMEEPAWKVAGELEEACSCSAPCPCWFKSLPTRMCCDGMQVVFITKGSFGKTALDGLAVGQFVQSPDGKSMFESFGNWNFDYIYVDERADAEQREALKVLAAHFFPPAAKAREYRVVPITRKIAGDEHTVTIGTYGACSGHLIDGGYNGPPKVTNPPLADPTHKEFLQGETTTLTYTDHGQGWKYEKSNYMRNTFEVDRDVYVKYEAELAKKMAEMKGEKK